MDLKNTVQATPIYTENEARTHARAIPEIRRKIQRVYGLSGAQMELPDTLKIALTNDFDAALNEDKWIKKRDGWQDPVNPSLSKTLDATAKALMLELARGFYIRQTTAEAIKQTYHLGDDYNGFYKNPTHRKQLIDIYISHNCNHTQAEFERATNGNKIASFDMLNYAIKTAAHCGPKNGLLVCNVEPGRRTTSTKDDSAEKIKSFGATSAGNLKTAFHYQSIPVASISKAVREARLNEKRPAMGADLSS